eukprot:tig00021108_g18295.t1
MEVRAVRAVEAGEELSIFYVDLWKPTAERQDWLRTTKFFICDCPRCGSPDEGERFLSGVRCPREACPGYACPEADGPELWRCSACGGRGPEPEGRPWDEVAAAVGEGLRMHALGCRAEGLAAVLETARAVLPEHHPEVAALLHALGAQLRRQARRAARREAEAEGGGGEAEATVLLRESVEAFRECAGSLLVLEGAAGRALAAARARLEEAEEDLAEAEAEADREAGAGANDREC